MDTMEEVFKIIKSDSDSTLHKLSIHNRNLIMKGNDVGCFYCCNIYSKDLITDWIDYNDDTALCPYCGVDSVISRIENINFLDLLKKMKIKWFMASG